MFFFFRDFLGKGRIVPSVGGGRGGIVGVLDIGELRQVPGLGGGGGEVWVGGSGSDCSD